MKYLLYGILLSAISTSLAQEKVNPVVKNFGGIYEIPNATVKPDVDLQYNIVIDIYGGSEDKSKVDRSLNNVARMINLHSVGGVKAENMNVVLAIHGGSTFSILNNDEYKTKFGMDNPNTELIKELKEVGVMLTVCGQSLKGRNLTKNQVDTNVELATSMLTTVTTYQLKGYAFLKF